MKYENKYLETYLNCSRSVAKLFAEADSEIERVKAENKELRAKLISVENPKIGEWWMVQSIDTLRKCPMIKVKNGWGSILNPDNKVLSDYIQRRKIFKPLYKMIKVPKPPKEQG